MGRAVVEREELLFAGYFVYRLWEVDEEGGQMRLWGTTTVRIVGGQPDPAILAEAKVILGDLAREHHLRVTAVAW